MGKKRESAASVIPIESAKDLEQEVFYRIVEHEMTPGDTFRGYQVERVVIADGRVSSRTLVDKPNLFEYAQSAMVDLMDPRNHVAQVDPNEFV